MIRYRWRYLWIIFALIGEYIVLQLVASRRFYPRITRDGQTVCVEVCDRGVPIWEECDFDGAGRPDTYAYCFGGKDMLLLNVDQNRRILGSMVTFYDELGKMKIMYADRTGSGEFTERLKYYEGKAEKDILLDNTWRETEKRGSLLGVTLDGQWCAVSYTNGTWAVQH